MHWSEKRIRELMMGKGWLASHSFHIPMFCHVALYTILCLIMVPAKCLWFSLVHLAKFRQWLVMFGFTWDPGWKSSCVTLVSLLELSHCRSKVHCIMCMWIILYCGYKNPVTQPPTLNWKKLPVLASSFLFFCWIDPILEFYPVFIFNVNYS